MHDNSIGDDGGNQVQAQPAFAVWNIKGQARGKFNFSGTSDTQVTVADPQDL